MNTIYVTYIPISEKQMSAFHNSNCMLLVHIYWNLFI